MTLRYALQRYKLFLGEEREIMEKDKETLKEIYARKRQRIEREREKRDENTIWKNTQHHKPFYED